MSSWEVAAPCAVCNHLRRECAPGCPCAPYFLLAEEARFALVDTVFGASNVANLLAALAPGQRANAVESLVARAVAHQQRGPGLGRLSSAIVDLEFRNILEQASWGHAAAAACVDSSFPVAGHAPASFQPFGIAAPPCVSPVRGYGPMQPNQHVRQMLPAWAQQSESARQQQVGGEAMQVHPAYSVVYGDEIVVVKAEAVVAEERGQKRRAQAPLAHPWVAAEEDAKRRQQKRRAQAQQSESTRQQAGEASTQQQLVAGGQQHQARYAGW